jgi:class 3 adenylate cyclase/CHASE2 domain-containing sensor protein
MIGKLKWNAPAILGMAVVCGALAASPAFGVLRGLSLDASTALRFRAFGPRHEPSVSPTVVVALDQDSYRAAPFKGTPTITWTREIGRVVTGVLDGGAKVVGFDVIFPTSIEDSQISFDDQTIGERMRGFDREYLRGLAVAARAGKLVLGEVQNGDEVVRPSAGQRAAVGQQSNIRSLNVYSERDGVVRHMPLMSEVGRKNVPSMSLELASRALAANPQVDADRNVRLADYRIPTVTPNAMTLNFEGGSNDIPTYSFADLRACLERGDTEFFRRNFEGKVVLLGSKLDFEDDKLTSKRFVTSPAEHPAERCVLPAAATLPEGRASIDGVYVHATAVNNLIRREAIAEMGGAPRWVIAAAGGTAGAIAASLLTPSAAASLFLLLALIWTAGSTVAFQHGIALPLFEPIVAGFMALVAMTSFRLFFADRDKRFLRRAFELYLAPAVIEKIVASSRPPELGGEMRDVTVFFSDIAGFASLAEGMKPSELVPLINRYLSAMTDIIEAHGGFVDKYIGDAIVAIFGAPAEGTDHAAEAVRAALACCTALENLNRSGPPTDSLRLAHRIGLNSGQALVGNIGSRRRFNYTAMGDCVNLASRLEGANKYLGTSILASQSTKERTESAFVWREIDSIRVKGRAESLRVYEPLGEAGHESPEKLAYAASYREGLARWRGRDFAGAAQSFAVSAATDLPSAFFLERAKRTAESAPEEGPGEVLTLEDK